VKKLLALNRSEIAIRILRAANELGLRTVAVYSQEDRLALHRFKADEAYLIGEGKGPVEAYLDVEGIVSLAHEKEVDAIHPGYGFLSENPALPRACQRAGITFIGPGAELLELLGDKTAARRLAQKAGIPVVPGTEAAVTSPKQAEKIASQIGFPLIVKAAFGGGGRGMRVVEKSADFPGRLEEARQEAAAAFGNDAVFIERFVRRARHIEVQILGDLHGNILHLYERDCSVQRRHQKVVEVAPAVSLDPKIRAELADAAVALAKAAGYQNAGTVEFLVDADSGEWYFIEVNPRIQVEHTVTEMVTGIDLVRCQIQVAQGLELHGAEINLPPQDRIPLYGYALQCRVTTEDPANNFVPDYGRLSTYRSPAGFGIRLDGGSAYGGAVITPYYDSLLVKTTAWGREFRHACQRMDRSLREFRVRGVKTNIPFLENVVNHADFQAGRVTTRWLEETPELFRFVARKDRATKLLGYLADVIVNGNPAVAGKPTPTRLRTPPIPPHDSSAPPDGTRQLLQQLGPEGLAEWVRKQRRLLLTDTTFRDAHQSLLATRVRTYDLLAIANFVSHRLHNLFSLEMWGGATFDVTMRFLHEDPFVRLRRLREAIPNICFQMLLRASNAVGYTAYPDNVVAEFIYEASAQGIDIFRIFDSLNWLPNMKASMEAVRKTKSVCEAAICYTGDILDPKRDKYSLAYYVGMAKELEKMGAHMLAIKDMAGLCKPYAAEKLVKALRQELGIPIHFHTHDTSGINAASVLKAADAGVDVADGAVASMSGQTSQPNLNSMVAALDHTRRATSVDLDALNQCADYWETVREYYAPFDTGPKAGTAEVYIHEMPGGQYTNLKEQAESMGLGARWHELARTYADVKHGVRRHREGDAVEQSGGRHGHLPGEPQHDHGAVQPSDARPQPDAAHLRHRDVHGLARRTGWRVAEGPAEDHPAWRQAAERPARRPPAEGRPGRDGRRGGEEDRAEPRARRSAQLPDVSRRLPEVRADAPDLRRSGGAADPPVLLRHGARRRYHCGTGTGQSPGDQVPHGGRTASRWNSHGVLRVEWPAARGVYPRPKIGRQGGCQAEGRSESARPDRGADPRCSFDSGSGVESAHQEGRPPAGDGSDEDAEHSVRAGGR
jgi:pyruvate carboxylase